MTNLERSIVKTLTFFDVFNYPLTASEIWKWLYKPSGQYNLADVREALKISQFLKDRMISIEGFYSLKGREAICFLRKENNNLAGRKFNKAIRLAKLYRLIPAIRMIAICNSLAYGNAKDDSDIDFFIITKKGRIWLARFLAIILAGVLGQRPKPGKHKDAFCLSFFIDEDNLNIQHLRLNEKDIYFNYWVSQLMPIYDPDGLYEKFLQANDWYKERLPNSYANSFSRQVKPTPVVSLFAKLGQWLLDYRWLYSSFRRLQVKIIDKNLRSLINVDTKVVVNDQMLKFHPNDRREMYYKRWRETLSQILK